ncbi:hypothetical protein [Paraburkholderia sp. J8-2]|uniref:hypothetical protein n=1 Tax=Paraburkholderia sp. J8-2 TaxID=2805440 RepID=UPI002AB6CC85|nr:hypothetical protein [Paraburkholderia sp. J8-2]
MPTSTSLNPEIEDLLKRVVPKFEAYPIVTSADLQAELQHLRVSLRPADFEVVLHKLRSTPVTPPPKELQLVAEELNKRYATREEVRQAISKVCPQISTRHGLGMQRHFRKPPFTPLSDDLIAAIGRVCAGKKTTREDVQEAAESLGFRLSHANVKAAALRLRIDQGLGRGVEVHGMTQALMRVTVGKSGPSMNPEIEDLLKRLVPKFETYSFVNSDDLQAELQHLRVNLRPADFEVVLRKLRSTPATPPPNELQLVAEEIDKRYATREEVRQAISKVCPHISIRQKLGIERHFREVDFTPLSDDVIVAIGRVCAGKKNTRKEVREAAESLGFRLSSADVNAAALRLRVGQGFGRDVEIHGMTRDLLQVMVRKTGLSMQMVIHRALVDSALRMGDLRTFAFDPRSEDPLASMAASYGLEILVAPTRGGTSR